jgi:hypothetical protein
MVYMHAQQNETQVKGIDEKYNRQCLSIKDIFEGDFDMALLVRLASHRFTCPALHCTDRPLTHA